MYGAGKLLRVAFAIAALLWPFVTSAEVTSPPLSDAVRVDVGDCKKFDPIEVPIITWGGDIATVLANGSSRTTTPDSIFGKLGLRVALQREDVFSNQVKNFLSCKTPFLRGTVGMINMASEVADRDPRTKLVTIYQLTWSSGGDALVVKEGIRSPEDLRGKTVAIQAYGPHVEYLGKLLSDAGLSFKDVKLRWTKDLTGTSETPGSALSEPGVDAAMVIIPDALALTSGGTIGTGAENSVRGARVLLSTKSANRVIADVYAVRADFLKSQRSVVERFVKGLLRGEELARDLVQQKDSRRDEYSRMAAGAAELLLDSRDATADTMGMYQDADFAGWAGNREFFTSPTFPRGFPKVVTEVQQSFQALGLISRRVDLPAADWNYDALAEGLTKKGTAEATKFDVTEVQKVVQKREQQSRSSEQTLFSFEVYFKPNQTDFPGSLYEEAFSRVINLASTYGGALITVEGHSDPLGYLQEKKKGAQPIVLNQLKQAGKNLSIGRANAVRDSLIKFAADRGVRLDPSQFATVGHGFSRPRNGVCGDDPCPPKTEKEWLDNMRVEFKIIQVEAEASVFKPL